MWTTEPITRVLVEFTSSDHPYPENAWSDLHKIVEQTPAWLGAFPDADKPSGLAIQSAFREYAAYLAANDAVQAMKDRVPGASDANQSIVTHQNRCFDLINAHKSPDDTARVQLALFSFGRLVLIRGVSAAMAGMLLAMHAMEEVDDAELARKLLMAAGKFCEDGRCAFEYVLQQVVELEELLRVRRDAENASMVVHTLLGLGGPKLFNVVMNHAAGQSPQQQWESVAESVRRLRSCEDKARYTRDFVGKLKR